MKTNYLIILLFIFIFSVNKVLSKEKISAKSNLSLPMGFIENKGQIMDQNGKPNLSVRYLLCQPGFNIQLKAGGFSYDTYTTDKNDSALIQKHEMLIFSPDSKIKIANEQNAKYHRIDIELEGSNINAVMREELPAKDYINFFTSGTPLEGITNVRHFQKIIYSNIYPNIDLEFNCKHPTNYIFFFVA